MSHYISCRSSVLRYAQSLWNAVKKKELNESAVSGLIDSFLTQPAYWKEWRDDLYDQAMGLKYSDDVLKDKK